MAIYRVQGPDGAIHRFEGPDNATPEQVEVFAAQQFGARQQEQKPQGPNRAAMNPEANVLGMNVSGEMPGGFNPAAALIKAGDVADSISKGGLQLMRGPVDWLKQRLGGVPDPLLERIKREREEAKQPMKDLAEVHPGSTAIAEAGMYMVSPNKAAPLVGALEYGSPTERATRAGVAYAGNKVGEKIGSVISRIPQPTRASELSQAQRAANEAADRIGVKLSAGEASGNKTLKWAEAATGDLPIAAGMSQARSAANHKAINRHALRSIGQEGDELTEAALAQARTDTSGLYKKVLDPAKIELDSAFRSEVKAISGSKVMRELRDESTDNLIGQFRNMPDGKVKVTGEWFQQNKTALDEQIRAAYLNGQPGKARALEQFEKALDRAAMRSLTDADKAAYKTAQRQWANLRMLETGKVVENGNAMPGRLDQALTTRYKGAYKEGRIKGELPDIARLASTLRQPPQSGSVPRAFYTGGIGGAAMVEPLSALTMLAGPASVQKLATSPAMRRYMEKGLMDVPPHIEELLRQGGGRIGAGGGLLLGP